jgi:hypothetical protein
MPPADTGRVHRAFGVPAEILWRTGDSGSCCAKSRRTRQTRGQRLALRVCSWVGGGLVSWSRFRDRTQTYALREPLPALTLALTRRSICRGSTASGLQPPQSTPARSTNGSTPLST